MSAPRAGLGGAVVEAVSGGIPSAFRSSESRSVEDPGSLSPTPQCHDLIHGRVSYQHTCHDTAYYLRLKQVSRST